MSNTSKGKAKVTLEIDGERKEFESGTLLLVVRDSDGKGTFTRAIVRDGGEAFFELYRNTREVLEDWEKEAPALKGIFEGWNKIFEHLKEAGIDVDKLGGGDDE